MREPLICKAMRECVKHPKYVAVSPKRGTSKRDARRAEKLINDVIDNILTRRVAM